MGFGEFPMLLLNWKMQFKCYQNKFLIGKECGGNETRNIGWDFSKVIEKKIKIFGPFSFDRKSSFLQISEYSYRLNYIASKFRRNKIDHHSNNQNKNLEFLNSATQLLINQYLEEKYVLIFADKLHSKQIEGIVPTIEWKLFHTLL